jgi:alpha-glucoside transport system substrate-binding protein
VVGAILTAVACGTGGSSNAGSVKVIAEWSGAEQANFMAVLKPFTDSTGIKVQYESLRPIDAVLRTRVAAGSPPDLAAAPNPALLVQFAKDGKVVPLNDFVDMNSLKANYSQSWIDLGEPLKDGKLYQVYSFVSVKGLVWYDPKMFTAKGYNVPKSWDEMIQLQNAIKGTGVTPWCVGLKSGGADDGWPGSDWIKEIVLAQSGPDVYDKWVAGTQRWSSDEIKGAFKTWGTVLGAGDSNVYGGNQMGALSFKTVGDNLFTNPPKCYMHNQASFITSFFTTDNPSLQAVQDFNFFPLPDINAAYAGAHVVAGDAWSMFHDTPQARKLVQYLTTADAQVIWVKKGGKLSPNNKTPLEAYPDLLSKESAQILVNTKIGRYDATDQMPTDMRDAAWHDILKFVTNQNSLDALMADLDKVQSTAYKSS